MAPVLPGFRPAVAAALVAACPASAGAQDAAADSLAEAAVFRRLRAAVQAGDTAAVAALMAYPVRVNRDGARPAPVRSARELRRRYGEVFPRAVRAAVLRQHPDSLFVSYRGSMVGRGEVWIATVCADGAARHCRAGVIAVNVPAAAPGRGAARRAGGAPR